MANLGIANIIIGAVCLLILLAVGAALFRGKRRVSAPQRSSSGDAHLGRAATPEPPSLMSRTGGEPRLGPSLSPTPSNPAPDAPAPKEGSEGAEHKVNELVRAQTEVAQALKILKGEFDTLRQSHRQMERRLAEAERLLEDSTNDGSATPETSAVSSLRARSGERQQTPARSASTAASTEGEHDEDSSLTRVRQAVEMLKRENSD